MTKKHNKINQALRRSKGQSVDVPLTTPKSNQDMGSFIRETTGHGKPKDQREIDKIKRAGVAQGYLLADDCVTILYDSRPGKKGVRQQEVADGNQ